MKKHFPLPFLAFTFLAAQSQDLSPKEKAGELANNVFSKTKHKKKEKDSIVTEVNSNIISTPVITQNFSSHAGNHGYNDLHYKIEIRLETDNKFMAFLNAPGTEEGRLENIIIAEAYFSAVRPVEGGAEEQWEDVLSNQSDNGTTTFGFGLPTACH